MRDLTYWTDHLTQDPFQMIPGSVTIHPEIVGHVDNQEEACQNFDCENEKKKSKKYSTKTKKQLKS